MAQQVQDIVLLRRRRIRRRRMQKGLLVLVVLLVALGLYLKRDEWFPKLEGIGSRYQTIRQNDGTLADGNFPLSVSGGIEYDTAELDGDLAILSDAYFYLYSIDGNQIESRQHAYANARMEAAGKKALIYESSGSRFRVEGTYKTVYQKDLDEQIVFARISAKGYVAVVTTSELCACVIRVYDDNGDEIYTRDCVERVIDLSFSPEGDGCTIAMLNASEGQMITTIRAFRFKETVDRWTAPPLDTLCISVYNTNDGGVFLMGDTKCAYYDSNGQLTGSYTYTGKLVDGTCRDGKAALLFENETKRQSSLVLLKRSVDEPAEISFDTIVKSVAVQNGNAYVLTKSEILSYSFGGKPEKSVPVSDSYESFKQVDDYMFLFGYDKIDRIDYEE